MSKSIELSQFIERSKQRQQDRMKLATVCIPGYEADFQLVSLGLNRVSEMMDGINLDKVSDQMGFYKELIYTSMPLLKSKELQEQYTCVEPFDIVFEVFTMDEIQMLADRIMCLNGLDLRVDDVKNS